MDIQIRNILVLVLLALASWQVNGHLQNWWQNPLLCYIMMHLTIIFWIQIYHEINHTDCNFKGNSIILYLYHKRYQCVFILEYFLNDIGSFSNVRYNNTKWSDIIKSILTFPLLMRNRIFCWLAMRLAWKEVTGTDPWLLRNHESSRCLDWRRISGLTWYSGGST